MPSIYFHSESIFHVIRVLKSCICQKTAPAIFEKKRFSLSLLCLSKSMLKVENGHAVQHPAPPVLRRAGAQGLNRYLDHNLFYLKVTVSQQKVSYQLKNSAKIFDSNIYCLIQHLISRKVYTELENFIQKKIY